MQSALQPAPAAKPGETASDVKMPSMLKQDQPVQRRRRRAWTTTAPTSKGTYTGGARLWQGDTSIKGDSIAIDDKTGDLGAPAAWSRRRVLEQTDKDKKKERAPSIAHGRRTSSTTTRRGARPTPATRT